MEFLTTLLILLNILTFYTLTNKHTKLQVKNKILEEEALELKEQSLYLTTELDKSKSTNSKILSQKKSSEVRLGNIAEVSLPFLKDLPYDCSNLKHLGQPIDFIYFNYDDANGPEIIIIEVKSGNSKHSKRQRMIKNAIRVGKVFYEEVRIDQNGIKVKRYQNE